jgi:hypothetical protein
MWSLATFPERIVISYRLALEKGVAGATYHAVAEEGIPVREICEVIGKGLNVPVVSLMPEGTQGHFGWAPFQLITDSLIREPKSQSARELPAIRAPLSAREE